MKTIKLIIGFLFLTFKLSYSIDNWVYDPNAFNRAIQFNQEEGIKTALNAILMQDSPDFTFIAEARWSQNQALYFRILDAGIKAFLKEKETSPSGVSKEIQDENILNLIDNS